MGVTTQLTGPTGAPFGVKALASRLKILNALEYQLASVRYRDVSVHDVAWLAGFSSSLFYRYFDDIESAVYALAAMHADPPPQLRRVLELVRAEDADWAVRRAPEPDTRLELLAALLEQAWDAPWTGAQAHAAFAELGVNLPADDCEQLLKRLAARGDATRSCGPIAPAPSPTQEVSTP